MTAIDDDKRFVWHPFTQMAEWVEGEALVIERAEGNYLIDTEGRRYLDGVSSLWVNVHGHRHPAIDQAIRDQLERVAHTTMLGLGSVPAAQLAARLVAVAPPGLTRVFYSDSGSTAVEIALKMAFQYQQLRGRPRKRGFLALAEAYHGDTIGAVSVGGIELFHSIFGPLLFDVARVPTPHAVGGDAALAALESVLRERADELAAFILEPVVQGAAGMLMQPPGFVRRAVELCRQHDVLVIADEVATGFGRTGTMFACEQEGVTPDLMCVAKGITGGYLPLAATLTSDAIYRSFLGKRSEGKHFFHGHSYTGNPLACAAALASLELFETERVLERVRRSAETLAGLMQRELAPLSHVGEIRQRGLMVGVELREQGERPFAPEQGVGAAVCQRCRAYDVIVRPLGDVVVLMPPLSVTEDELAVLVGAVRRSVTDVLG